MIQHTATKYPSGFVAYDDIAQAAAERLNRQEVTADWYLDNMGDKPLWRWIEGEAECGLDPWRLDPDDIYRPGIRIFVQRKDIPAEAR